MKKAIVLAFISFLGLFFAKRATVLASTTPCNSDINQDTVVDITDYSLLVGNFLKQPIANPRTDINSDGEVDITDYSLLVSDFLKTGLTCTSPTPTPSNTPAPLPIVNLLQNGGFETGSLTNWQDVGTVTVQTQDKHSGTYAARVTSNSNPRQQWITVTPGRTYVVSAWFKWNAMSNSDWGYSRIGIQNDSFQDIAGINNLDQLYQKGVWNKVAFSFTPTVNRVGINFGMFGPESTIDMYFDDIMLFEKTGNIPPTINPQASSTSGSVPFTVNFTANGDDADGSIATYQWIFGDGSEERIANPSHTFMSAGTFTVTLNAFDNDGAKVSKNLTITVTDTQAPQVQITSPSSANTFSTSSTTVSLSGTSNTSSGQITNIVWDNVTADDAGIISITPAASVNWNAGTVQLKPGTNEFLITATNTAGKVITDKLIINRTISGPSIQNITTNTTTPKVYEKYEATFNVTTVADQPMFMYDANPPAGVERYSGATVEGVITLPNGQQVTHPAFYFEETTKVGSNFRLTGNKSWKLRFSPQQVGNHAVAIRVTDKSGTSTTQVGSFNAQAPTRPGFIKVSQSDPRYFEYSNGSIHWPIGMTWSGTIIPENGSAPSAINYDRPWMAGQGGWSSNWARWKSTGEAYGNEGIGMHYSYNEHYPSSEISQVLDYPNGWKMWISCWLDEKYCGNINSGATYQVKLRLKTTGITGPKQSGIPYGLMLKYNPQWPPSDDVYAESMRSALNWIPLVSTNRDWHTIVTRVTAPSSGVGAQFFSLYLDNVTGGSAYIDELSIREVLSNGTLGPEQVRNPQADWHTYVEQRPMAGFDEEVARGEANGINLRYVVHDKNDRLINAINSSGVFVTYGGGYYQAENTKATWLQKQWWRYLVARLGYSTSVFAWELNNEGPPDDGTGAHARHTEIFGKWMHQLDAHKHLATTSFWCCWEPTFWGDKAKFPNVDFGDIHHYGTPPDMVQWYLDEALPVINSNVGRPVVRGETGIMGSDTNTSDPSLRSANPGVWYHDMLWSQLHYSSFYEIGYWYPDHGAAITGGMTPHARAFSNFVNSLDLNKGGYQNASATSAQTKFTIFGQKNLSSNKAFLWVHHVDNTWKKVQTSGFPPAVSGTVTFNMNANRTYTVTQYDTYTGSYGAAQQITSNGSGVLSIPVNNLSKDTAFKIN